MMVVTSTPKGWKIGAEIIKWYQGTTFSHVAIIEGKLVYQASHGYVNCWYIDTFMEENNVVSYYEIPDSAVDMEYVKKQLGKKYGFGQLLSIAWQVLTKNKLFSENGDKKLICSELVGRALKQEWVNDHTTPEEIDDYLRKITRRD